MVEIVIDEPANKNEILTGIEASVYELQAAAKLAIEACEDLQRNIQALDKQMAHMDAGLRTYESSLSDLDHGLEKQGKLSEKLCEIMSD